MPRDLFLKKSAVVGAGLMGVEHKDRIAGAHFVQPGHIVPVVEVIRTPETSDTAMDRNCEVWERLDRMPSPCWPLAWLMPVPSIWPSSLDSDRALPLPVRWSNGTSTA